MLRCEITEVDGDKTECEIAELYKQLDEQSDDQYVDSPSSPADMDEMLALTMDYDTNFKLSEIKRIIDYYNDKEKIIRPISRNKEGTINALVLFELDPDNQDIVTRRKTMWLYLKVIREDNHLSKYLILK